MPQDLASRIFLPAANYAGGRLGIEFPREPGITASDCEKGGETTAAEFLERYRETPTSSKRRACDRLEVQAFRQEGEIALAP